MPDKSKSDKAPGLLSRLAQAAAPWRKENLPKPAEITPYDLVQFGGLQGSVSSLMATGGLQARMRFSIYEKWEQMQQDPICSSALKLLTTGALGGHESTGEILFLEREPIADENTELGKIVDEMESELAPILNQSAFTLAYLAAAFGDAYARIYADKDGVQELYTGELVRPVLVQPFERGARTVGYAVFSGENNFQRLDVSQMARVSMPRTHWIPQIGVFEKSLLYKLTEDDRNALPLMPSMVGGSLLYPAEVPYDRLSAALLGITGQRLIDSIDEQVMTVDVSNMNKEAKALYLNSIRAILKRSKELAAQAVSENSPVMERVRYLIPTWREKQIMRVESPNAQSGRGAPMTVEDIMLHARLLSGAINVDLAMIGFADQMAGGLGEGGFFRVSAQAAETARMIRGALIEAVNHICDIHTLHKYGAIFPPESRPWRAVLYGSISALEKERAATINEGMQIGTTLTQVMQQLKEIGADEKGGVQFLTDVMKLDEDQARVYAKWLKAPKGEGEGDDGGGFKGRG